MKNAYTVSLIKDGFIPATPWLVKVVNHGSGKGTTMVFRTKTRARGWIRAFTEMAEAEGSAIQ